MRDPSTVDHRVSRELREKISELLVYEAALLDERRFAEWLALAAPDINYRMPLRINVDVRSGPDVVEDASFFEDDRETLAVRLARFETSSAWAEDPPTRTRHFITNIDVQPRAQLNEFSVTSYLLLARSRGSSAQPEILTGHRSDVWRCVGDRWQLAERRVILDQTVLGTPNLTTIY